MATTKYVSDELFHLVGRRDPANNEQNYQTLLKVIDASHISHPPHTKDGSLNRNVINTDKELLSEELIVPTITCFCDIPFEHLGVHKKKYGLFGLSFHRDHLLRNNARPVIYIPTHRSDVFTMGGKTLLADIEQTWRGFDELVAEPLFIESFSHRLGDKPLTREDAIRRMNYLFKEQFLAFIKPFNAELPEDHPDNFYLEREWRKYGYLSFTPDKVVKVLVATDFVDRLKAERPAYTDKVYGIDF